LRIGKGLIDRNHVSEMPVIRPGGSLRIARDPTAIRSNTYSQRRL
jgi:hypothetical protein